MQGRRVRFPMLLLATLLAVSCNRPAQGSRSASGGNAPSKPTVSSTAAPGQKEAPNPGAQPSQPKPIQTTPAAQAPAQVQTQAQAPKPPAPPKEATPAAVTTAPKRDRGLPALFSLDPKRTATPEDFRIGPLSAAGAAGLAAEDAEALRGVAALLDGLTRGTVAADLLAADRKEALTRLLEEAVREGDVPLRYRLGPVTRSAQPGLRVNVRLFSAEGSAEGELFLRKEETRWLIEDVQVRFESLARQRQPAEEEFFPSTYRWLMEDF